LSLPRGRPADDELPPAALHLVHAGLRLRRNGADESGLRARDRGWIPLLLVRRCLPAGTARMTLGFALQATDGDARAGVLRTAHGDVPTPVFMPVGTAGTVKAMTADAVRATGASIVLGNTYHLMLRPGAERVAALGGLHRFMDWPGPILT